MLHLWCGTLTSYSKSPAGASWLTLLQCLTRSHTSACQPDPPHHILAQPSRFLPQEARGMQNINQLCIYYIYMYHTLSPPDWDYVSTHGFLDIASTPVLVVSLLKMPLCECVWSPVMTLTCTCRHTCCVKARAYLQMYECMRGFWA